MAPGHLHQTIQHPPHNLRPPLRRALQSSDSQGSGDGYLRTVCDYVHLNPVRARIIPPETSLETFQWSSYPAYLAPAQRPKWLRVDRLLGEHGIGGDTVAGRAELARRMEKRRRDEASPNPQLERGWCLGSEEFRRELVVAAQERVGPNHYAEHRREAQEQRAERIVSEELRRHGRKEKEAASSLKMSLRWFVPV